MVVEAGARAASRSSPIRGVIASESFALAPKLITRDTRRGGITPMSLTHFAGTGAAVFLAFALGGCGLIGPHIDCDQVAQQQRAGSSKEEIASATGFSVGDVESCSSTPKREASNSNYDQPLLPIIPNISAGAVHPSSISGIGAR